MNWTMMRLKNIARVDYGLGQPPTLGETGIPILRATNINRGKFTSNGLIFANKKDLPLGRAPLLTEGEILVVRSGAYTGDSALVTRDWIGSAPGYDLRVSPTTADPVFLAYYLLSTTALDQIDLARERAAQPHLNAEDLREVCISVPPLGDQRRIAHFLDAEAARIDLLIGRRRDQFAVLDELVLSVIENVINKVHKYPSVRLGYLALVQTGVTVDGNRQNGGNAVTLPYLRVANVQVGRVDLTDVSEITVSHSVAAASRLRPGDVLMTEGGDLDKLGRGTVWQGEIDDCLHQNHVFAVRPNSRVLDPAYLALLTRAPMARQYFESTGNKTTNLASTSSSKIRDFRIPLADAATQRAIVKEVDARLRSISEFGELLAQQLVLLAERRQALITAAVTGQIDVTTARVMAT